MPENAPESKKDLEACRAAYNLGYLTQVAQDVVDRWDSPLWRDVPATGEFITRLRHAIQNAKS